MENFFQIILLMITSGLFHLGITNPNLTSKSDYVAREHIFMRIAVAFGPTLGKFILWVSSISQIAFLYSQEMSTWTDELRAVFSFSSVTILGFLLMLIGGIGRIWCYKVLGSFFTYHITIRNSHRLIKIGPYAYVRHPSYSFVSILTVGMYMIHRRSVFLTAPNSYFQWIKGPLGFWLNVLILVVSLAQRIVKEEAELKKQFGKEWDQYASSTPRLIPHLI